MSEKETNTERRVKNLANRIGRFLQDENTDSVIEVLNRNLWSMIEVLHPDYFRSQDVADNNDASQFLDNDREENWERLCEMFGNDRNAAWQTYKDTLSELVHDCAITLLQKHFDDAMQTWHIVED